MKALRIDAPGALSFTDLPRPEPGPGEVAITIDYIGYCGSDLSSFRGKNPLVGYPRIPGHEISGTVAALGPGLSGPEPGLSGPEPGRRVTVLPYFNCGHCRACRLGRPNACLNNQTLGVQREGALTERICVPVGKVVPIDGLSARDVALVEPIAVGFHAVRRAEVAADETVVVLGCGVIGLGAALGALNRGARVIATDMSATKLATAAALGVQHTIDASAEDVAARVRGLTDGDGAAVVIEAAGVPATFRQAVDLAGQCGRVAYIGYAKDEVSYETRFFVMKEIDIRGSRGSELSDFRDVIAYLEGHPGAGDLIVSRVVPLSDAIDALEAWDADPGRYTKILVDLAGSRP